MASAFVEDFRTATLSRDELLEGIIYFRVHDFVEQFEVTESLPALLEANPSIVLVVIDSVAFHFRHAFEEHGQRLRALNSFSLKLKRLASDHGLAVSCQILVIYQVEKCSLTTASLWLPRL
ncbi:TPA: hypothetical protein N0F65_007792 [Lagenidium giganteum]|uniref:DNA repair protein RAD51 homolog 3 n=1 Tax=Lagenidium giganteum TaxID=4803 RepID=A0AAV2Z332_9STRA|nr:TPA: hypothetical protein N0F65_007792 [Lagenidium giganteum]